MSDLERFRELFPITRNRVYMNHAAIGPLPTTAVNRIAAVSHSIAMTGDDGWYGRIGEIGRVRGLAARLLHAREEHEVGFVANTSDGLSIISAGLDWREGDTVVGANCEFPSNAYPWMRLSNHGVTYRMVEERDGRVDFDDLVALVDEHTRVVALSWVQFGSGFRSDLERIGRFCRERGILFVVDGIQGLGVLPIDVERDHVDVLAASAHKWLCGSEGIGLLYISDRVIDRLDPVKVGWTSTKDWIKFAGFDLRYRDGAERFECGTMNPFGVAALGSSLEILLEAGEVAIERQVRILTDLIVAGLIDRGYRVISSRSDSEWSAIVTATHDDRNPGELVQQLKERNISVAARAGRVRISPHFYNTVEEVDRLLAAM